MLNTVHARLKNVKSWHKLGPLTRPGSSRWTEPAPSYWSHFQILHTPGFYMSLRQNPVASFAAKLLPKFIETLREPPGAISYSATAVHPHAIAIMWKLVPLDGPLYPESQTLRLGPFRQVKAQLSKYIKIIANILGGCTKVWGTKSQLRCPLADSASGDNCNLEVVVCWSGNQLCGPVLALRSSARAAIMKQEVPNVSLLGAQYLQGQTLV